MSDSTNALEHRIATIRAAESAGDYLLAFDLASQATETFPDSEEVKYLAVRAIARAGSLARAESLYRDYGLKESTDVDTRSLRARIAKDRFISNPRDKEVAQEAAGLYQHIYEDTDDPYPGINAATLWMLAGDKERARHIASRVTETCKAQVPDKADDEYWRQATLAEVALLLGNTKVAAKSLSAASSVPGRRADAIASTLKQLSLICTALDIDAGLLDRLPRPTVIVYAGHMISPPESSGRFPADRESEIKSRITEEVERRNVEFGYGSLASGADILFAEALLEREAELHVVLPFADAEFIEVSVAPAKAEWVVRFKRCLAKATSVTYATRDAYLGDDELFAYAGQIAMGLARIRAGALEARLEMLAVWDRVRTGGKAGTAADVAFWTSCDLPLFVIDCDWGAAQTDEAFTSQQEEKQKGPRRSLLPVLFSDFENFSELQEQHLPIFNRHVMGLLGDTLREQGDAVLFRNTWGDAVHAVFSDVEVAADCALLMQEKLEDLDSAALGLPGKVAMRISLHAGPVFVGCDYIVGGETYFGRTLTRAARMEPVTPEKEVYVTEQFAALIEMSQADRVRCNYVGLVPLKKNYGEFRMYRLAKRAPDALDRVSQATA